MTIFDFFGEDELFPLFADLQKTFRIQQMSIDEFGNLADTTFVAVGFPSRTSSGKQIEMIIHVHVENQIGCHGDCTAAYVAASGWDVPSDVAYDAENSTLSGEANSVLESVAVLQSLVREAGHGCDCGDEDPPILSYCNIELVGTGSEEDVARLQSIGVLI